MSGGEVERVKVCGTCLWHRDHNDFGGAHCWRFPPTPAFQVAFDGSGASHYENLRPWTLDSETCGEWSSAHLQGDHP